MAAFNRVAQYDACISNYLSSITDEGGRGLFPAQSNSNFVKVMDLRYGENPHQHGAFYRDLYPVPGTLATFTQLQGKELSFNNLADADAAWECVRQFEAPACVIVKHANPCGVAVGVACGDAYELAYATDPTSAFGGIIAFNTKLDAATAKVILDRQFVEVLIAPDFETAALDYATKKANVRVLQHPARRGPQQFRRQARGLGPADADQRHPRGRPRRAHGRHPLAPTDTQMDDLLFAWRVAKFVKSNAIVYAKDRRSIGIGAGQMSRVVGAQDRRHQGRGGRVVGAGLGDGLAMRSSRSATASTPRRPPASRRSSSPADRCATSEVIAAADEHGLAMVFTGVRHFRH